MILQVPPGLALGKTILGRVGAAQGRATSRTTHRPCMPEALVRRSRSAAGADASERRDQRRSGRSEPHGDMHGRTLFSVADSIGFCRVGVSDSK